MQFEDRRVWYRAFNPVLPNLIYTIMNEYLKQNQNDY